MKLLPPPRSHARLVHRLSSGTGALTAPLLRSRYARYISPIAAIILLIGFARSTSAVERELLYQLLSDRHDADLNYPFLKGLWQQELRASAQIFADKPPAGGYTMLVEGHDLEPFFLQPIAGRARVLTFCALNMIAADPIEGEPALIGHHLLVLKVDAKGRILDGYYFMRDWQEAPMLHLLLRFRPKNRFLSANLLLSSSDFRQDGNGKKPKYFNPTGHLDNLLNFKKVF